MFKVSIYYLKEKMLAFAPLFSFVAFDANRIFLVIAFFTGFFCKNELYLLLFSQHIQRKIIILIIKMNNTYNLLYFKEHLIDFVRNFILDHVVDIIPEEIDTFMQFYLEDHVEVAFDKVINHYYENAYGYDTSSLNEKIKKLFDHYKEAELKHNTGPNLQYYNNYNYQLYTIGMNDDDADDDDDRVYLYFTYNDYFNVETLKDIIVQLQLFDELQTLLK
jgi:hypothetical protein